MRRRALPAWFFALLTIAALSAAMVDASAADAATAGAAQSAITAAAAAKPAQLFAPAEVRLLAGPFLDAQTTDLHYLLALEPDRLLAPFLREAGLPLKQESYGNWEASGLDGHMGGHYLSALAMMYAATGDTEVLRRLDYMVTELRRCQRQNGKGYLGGIPGGAAAWAALAKGELRADSFSVNGKWVPWYNLHKLFAGLRDAYRYAGNDDARQMLVALADWAFELTAHLSDAQMQTMLRSEQGGMNEVLADVFELTADKKYLALAIRFSHQAVLQPLIAGQDKLTGLHANTQIPKVIGFKRIGDLTGQPDWQQAARFFWQTVREHRTVAIGGNSVKEHFHDAQDYSSMVAEVEGPETCNTYNMLKLTELLFLGDRQAGYVDYYERALYNHILSSQHPDTGGFVYFTPMRANHYRVYSQPDKAMWCCVGSGIESGARYNQFIYAHDRDDLYVNLFVASTLHWREKNLTLTQETRFPDQDSTRITISAGAPSATPLTIHIRHPEWVGASQLRIRVNGKPVAGAEQTNGYVALRRLWRAGDVIEVALPMHTRLEQMPDQSNYYAVLHGPIVLAAKTRPFAGERLNYLADDSRMGHIAAGPVCPAEAAPLFVSDTKDFLARFKPVAGSPLTFSAGTLVQGPGASAIRFIPFFRLHDSRYMLYWQVATPAGLVEMQRAAAEADLLRRQLEARTIDQVAPGEQQPEVEHDYQGDGAETGSDQGLQWRQAKRWFGYTMRDPRHQATVLRLTYGARDAGRQFDLEVNGVLLQTIVLGAHAGAATYTQDYALPTALSLAGGGALNVKLVARPGSIAGRLYGLRLLR